LGEKTLHLFHGLRKLAEIHAKNTAVQLGMTVNLTASSVGFYEIVLPFIPKEITKECMSSAQSVNRYSPICAFFASLFVTPTPLKFKTT
jgi:hypothetical protein